MFFPLHDRNPLKIVPFQFVTLGLMAISGLAYLWEISLSENARVAATFGYGLIPAIIAGEQNLPPDLPTLPTYLTLFSYQFLHADVWHLLGNMLFLWVFGDNIEDSMGHARYLFFYLLCGVVAGMVHSLLAPSSVDPVIGASGAVSGLLGAYLVLHPRVKILVLLLKHIPLYLPAYLLIGGWLLVQFVSLFISDEPVAWWAHIGGFFAGSLLIVPLRYPHIPLFDAGTEH